MFESLAVYYLEAFTTVFRVQRLLIEKGWRWRETVFDDGSAIVHITQSDDCHAFSRPHHNAVYGWGRFPRPEAWHMVGEWVTRWESIEAHQAASYGALREG
jgi:hypothetical protein